MVEEAIINNTIGDIDEVNVMEKREGFDEEEEQTETGNKHKGAEKDIGEMEIDKDL